MKKKIFLLPLLLLALIGCSNKEYYNKERPKFGESFEVLCMHDSILFLLDTDTNYVYLYFANGFGRSVSIYYNEKGQPMNYDEFKLVHNEKYHKGEQR